MPVNPIHKLYTQFPEPVTGYELNPCRGLFSVIIPEATTNLVTNPSVEFGITTGYTAYNGAMAATYDWQAFGACGLKLTPAVSTESGCYYGTISLTAGVTYTASVVIQGEAGKDYTIWFASNAGALIGSKRKWTGTGHKQRIWVTYTETSSTTRRVYVTRDAKYADQNVFYADGLQVEAKAYPTTYCDGDQTGFVINQNSYYWNGEARASTSSRSAQTTAGGREVNLLDLGLRILAIIGLGMPVFVDQSLPIPGRGELIQGTGNQAREFSLAGAVSFDGPRHRQAVRAGLIDAFNPFLTNVDQPIILRYQGQDEDGEPWGESLDIYCKYRGGLEGVWDNHHQERIALNFKMYLPMIYSTYDAGIDLELQENVVDADFVIRRVDNLWMALGTGVAGCTLPGGVLDILKGNDGSIYVAGDFTSAGGVANTRGIALWNPVTNTWSALGTGADDGLAYTLVKDADGNIYAGGTFTGMGGVANTDGIAMWNGAAWSSIGDLGGTGGYVRKLLIGPTGRLYAGGTFTNIGGVAANSFAMYDLPDTSLWYSYGVGLNGVVNAMAFAPNGLQLYLGGGFTTAAGYAYPYIVRLVDDMYWEPVTANGIGLNGPVADIAIAADDKIYVGGTFLSTDGLDRTAGLARWTGYKWESLGPELVPNGGTIEVNALKFDAQGNLYIGGSYFRLIGESSLSNYDNIAVYTGSHFQRIGVDLPNEPVLRSLFEDTELNTLYLGYNQSGTAVIPPSNGINISDVNIQPIVIVDGPGYLFWIENITTGKKVYFNYDIQAGERIGANLDPVHFQVYSSLNGNIMGRLQSTENFDLGFVKGTNQFRILLDGVTVDTAAFMYWRDQFLSIDTAVWE